MYSEFLRLQFVVCSMFSIRVRYCRVSRSARIDLACPYHNTTPARPQRPTVGGSRSSKFKPPPPPLHSAHQKKEAFHSCSARSFFSFLFFYLRSVSQDVKRSVNRNSGAVSSLVQICVDRQVSCHLRESNELDK